MISSSFLLTLMFFFLFVLLLFHNGGASASASSVDDLSAEDFLSLGDEALSSDLYEKSIRFYEQGVALLTEDESILTELSLYTNYGSALSSIGKNEESSELYKRAIRSYSDTIEDIPDNDVKQQATDIASQASFFLGMVYQDLGRAELAADAYSYANTLDPYHWASLANLGSVLQDHLSQHGEALLAYNKAYEILTETDPPEKITDAPEEPRYILSQLQYRMGLCINHAHLTNQRCTLMTDPDKKESSCKELATHAFSLAVQYDPENEAAKHMLATSTADATMKRATNTYVKSLFDDYAENFEHSLVDELGYNGYERLRRGFNRAFKDESIPMFEYVVDAGCGTGLVGEQFRNISQHLLGIDLSEAILMEAQKARPNLYDDIKAGDITEIFQQMPGKISLILAGDSYIYFGDLVPLFQSMEIALEENGYAAFTLENVSAEDEKVLQESKEDWRWQLTASGRFAHRKEYVLSLGMQHNLSLIHYEPLDDFRFERGIGVRGHIFVMQKTAPSKSTNSNNDEL